MAISVSDLITLALTEIGVARAGDVLPPESSSYALAILNELIDAWNADNRALYTTGFQTFTLTPSLQPHTIGLVANTPTFVITAPRPTTIRGANLVLTTSSPNVRVPLRLRDDAWWRNVRVQGITSSIPTDLYYSPDWPNGSIYLWPVPLTAYGLELETETALAAVALTDTFTLPPAYQQAMRLTLAELCANGWGQPVTPTLTLNARNARARAFGSNDTCPNLATADAGVPRGRLSGGYDYRTGFTS